MQNQKTLTILLRKAGEGHIGASNELFETVYDELKAVARAQLNGLDVSRTFDTTALVHEAYLKMFDHEQLGFRNRTHFFALSAKVMRQILVDYYRKKTAVKRGGARRDETLPEIAGDGSERAKKILMLDQALLRLEELNTRLATVVECKFFTSMKLSEIATYLGVTDRTIRNDWYKAKIWLAKELMEHEF